jgi:ESAT-6 family protein
MLMTVLVDAPNTRASHGITYRTSQRKGSHLMGAIKVTSEQLHSVSSQLSTGSEDVSQQLESMRTKVQALVDADWNGAASDSFRDLWQEWHSGARQVKQALDGISQMLGQAATKYQDTEDELARSLRV